MATDMDVFICYLVSQEQTQNSKRWFRFPKSYLAPEGRVMVTRIRSTVRIDDRSTWAVDLYSRCPSVKVDNARSTSEHLKLGLPEIRDKTRYLSLPV
jgi:hypothetical protein